MIHISKPSQLFARVRRRPVVEVRSREEDEGGGSEGGGGGGDLISTSIQKDCSSISSTNSFTKQRTTPARPRTVGMVSISSFLTRLPHEDDCYRVFTAEEASPTVAVAEAAVPLETAVVVAGDQEKTTQFSPIIVGLPCF